MSFLITTTGATGSVTLHDLGGRIFPNTITNFDLEAEYKIEEIRYSEDLASAIHNDGWIATDDLGRIISAQSTLTDTKELLRESFHALDTDDLPEGSLNLYLTDAEVQNSLNNLSINDLGDVNTLAPADNEVLTWNSGTGMWEPNPAPAAPVLSVNGLTGTVVLNTDNIGEGTGNLYYTDARARQSISVAAGSTDYLTYDNITGSFSVKSLLITNVTVDSTNANLTDFVTSNYIAGTEFQEGDTVILSVATNGPETWIHNGGTAGTVADFTIIDTPHLSDTEIRSKFSVTGLLDYDPISGVFNLNNIDLTSDITGILPTTNGGTGINSGAVQSGQILIGNDPISKFTLGFIGQGDGIEVINGPGTISIGILDTSINPIKLNSTNSPLNGQVPSYNSTTQTFTWSDNDAQNLTIVDNLNGTINFILSGDTSPNIFNLDTALNNVSINSHSDVDGSGATSEQALVWNAGLSRWEPGAPIAKKSWTWGAASRASSNTNRYLDRQDGSPTNIQPYIAFFDCKIKAISLNARVATTWSAQVFVNGSQVASLSSGGSKSAYNSTYNVLVSAGDEVAIFCSGTSINRPSVDVLIEEI